MSSRFSRLAEMMRELFRLSGSTLIWSRGEAGWPEPERLRSRAAKMLSRVVATVVELLWRSPITVSTMEGSSTR